MKSDVKCARAHLEEAKKSEDCPPCGRRIDETVKQLPRLLKERKAEEKITRLIGISKEAAGISREMKAIEAIKPESRGLGVVDSVKGATGRTVDVAKSAGGAIKGAGDGTAHVAKSAGDKVSGGASWFKRNILRRD